MNPYQTCIHLKDTDATGVLYFSQQFSLALEAFEHFLKAQKLSLQKVIQENSFLLPIVHAEGDYFAPLLVGDEIEIFTFLEKTGNSSFTLHYKIMKEGRKIGQVKIVHVTVSKKTNQSIPIPEILLKVLQQLPQVETGPGG
jgi:1,4-dihydroxy-2-naphthoyl-CoA hydrolase